MKKATLIYPLLSLSLLSATELIQVPTVMSVDRCSETMINRINSKKGFGVFAIIDHQKNAQKVGLTLPEQKVIIFGNPKAGTLLMQEDAQIGYDLPLRIMVRDEGAQRVVEYRSAELFEKDYKLNNSPLPTKIQRLLEDLAHSCQ